MAQLTVSTHIDATPEEAFDVFVDLENAAERIRGIERMEILTDGPIGLGTRFRETRIMFKKEATEEMEIVRFDRPHGYDLAAASCGAKYLSTYTFVPEGNGIRVDLNFVATPVTFFAKLMSPVFKLMSGSLRKCVAQDLDDLKKAVESKKSGAAA